MVSVRFRSWSFTDITTGQYPTGVGRHQPAGIAFRPQHGDDLLLGGCGQVLSLLVLANIYPQVLDKPSSDDVRSQCLAYEEWEFFLTSSMLTESAFTPNMALGLLITCGVLLQQLKQHFLGLIQNGVLVSVQ